jgi:hypothetical protein
MSIMNLPVLSASYKNALKPFFASFRGWATVAIGLFLFSGLVSCTEEIDLQLNAANPKIIIEGAITDQRVPYEVKISKSINFNAKNEYPPVRGAFVMIVDNAGNRDTLREANPGIYRTTSTRLRGTVTRRYTLTVRAEGQEFTASSILSRAVGLDSLTIQKDELATQFENSATTTFYQVLPIFTDPRDEPNYYFFNVFTKSETEKGFYNLMNDTNKDGLENFEPIYFSSTKSKSKDSLTVEMWCIDKSVHTYFNSLNQIQNNQSGTPTNPVTNIQGGALGYFSAHSVRTKRILIP